MYLPTVCTVRYFSSVILLPTGGQNISCLLTADPNICEIYFILYTDRTGTYVTDIATGLSILVGSLPSTYRTISKQDLTFCSIIFPIPATDYRIQTIWPLED